MYVVSARAMAAGRGPTIASLFDWLATDEGYMLFFFGTEGVHYNLVNGAVTQDGIPDPNLGYTMPAAQPFRQIRSLVGQSTDMELAAAYPTYIARYSGKTMSSLVTLREVQSRPWTSWNGADTLPNASADLQRFYQQGLVEFVLGQRPLNPASWAAWVAEFERIGGLEWERAAIAFANENGFLVD